MKHDGFTIKNIRLLASDLDGTLLNRYGKISARTKAAILSVQEKGIVFAVCTGRFSENAAILLKDHGIECPLVSLNGCVVQTSTFGPKIASHAMAKETALRVHQTLEETGAVYYAFGERFVLIREPDGVHHSQSEFGNRMETECMVKYLNGKEAAAQCVQQPIYKFFVYQEGDSASLETIRESIRDIPDIFITQSSDINIEIMQNGIDKGTGLKELADLLNISVDQTMAFGDQDNDLSMIQTAAVGVAVGNATAQLKRAAQKITGCNTEDGVAKVMEDLLADLE